MRRTIQLLFIVAIGTSVVACGPTEEELRQQEQARRDSLERVQAMRQAEIADAEATANGGANEQAEAEAESASLDITTLRFSDDGAFSVQVGSWRSETKADELANIWKTRGFNAAFVEKYGTDANGDVWFRVRLGRLASRSNADALASHVKSKYGVMAWVDSKKP